MASNGYIGRQVRTALAWLSIVLVSAVAVTGLSVTAATSTVRPVSKLSPASGTYWGIYTKYGITNREPLVGRTFNIEQKYRAWTDNLIDSVQQDDIAAGRIPLVTWEPWSGGQALSANEDTDIANGVFDANIISRAQQVASFGQPIFIRFGHEMNGNWYPWDGSHNNNDPSLYVAAYRHVHDIFVAQGATNAVWVWCPNATDVPAASTASWNHWSNYYPGDNYVDWVGVDGYNWGTTQTWSTWQSFASVFRGGASGLYADYSWKKAFMIVETGSAESGGSKSGWITDMASQLQTTFPLVQALVWFDSSTASGTAQWPIDSSADALSAYTAAGHLGYFNPPVNWSLGATATGPIKGIGGKCVQNKSGALINANKIQLYTCGKAGEQWTVSSLTGQIQQATSGYCLDVAADSTAPKTKVQLYQCNGSPGEQWTIVRSTGAVVNPNSGLCLEDANASTANGNQIWVNTCSGITAQRWTTALP